MAPILSHSQLYNRFWPPEIVQKNNNDPSAFAATFSGDTLFFYQQTEKGAYFYNLRLQYQLTLTKQDSFFVDYYPKGTTTKDTLPYYTNYYTPDSIRYLYLSKRAHQLDSMVLFANGNIQYRCTITDSSKWIYTGDSLGAQSHSITYFKGDVIALEVKKDTLFHHIPCRVSYRVFHGDTQSYHLADTKGRVYRSLNGYRSRSSVLQGTDTIVYHLVQKDTVRVDQFKKDSTISHFNISSSSYDISVVDYASQTNVLSHFYQEQITSKQITKTTGDHTESVSYGYKKGKPYLRRTEEATPFLRTVIHYNEKGKKIDKTISEWDGNGGLIKTTRWRDGQKTVQYPEDLIVTGPKCGVMRNVLHRDQYPQIDSVKVIVEGDTLSSVYYNLMFFKVDTQWYDLELFEGFLMKHYFRYKDTSEDPFILAFNTTSSQSTFKYIGPNSWRKNFGKTPAPSIAMYNNLLLGPQDSIVPTKILLYIGLGAGPRSINKYTDHAAF